MNPAINAYLDLLDTAVPGGYTGVYVTGSAAIDDWRPGRSDLDILTLTDGPLSAESLDALATAHQSVVEHKPHLDAIYLPVASVGRRTDGSGIPHVIDGVFRRDGYLPDPVLWAIFDRNGITVRGPAASSFHAGPDPEWLREWNIGNLNSFWHGWSVDARGTLRARDPASPISSDVACFALLGPGRLHHTIATGDILTKTAAADYTAEHFPAYVELLGRAKAWRLGDESVTFNATDGLAICDLVDAVIADVV